MEVRIENQLINPTIDLLHQAPLKGKQSRHRTKFIKMLSERLKEVVDEQDEILKEHCHLDDEGNPAKDEYDNYKIKDHHKETFLKDRNELYREEFVIDDGNSQVMLKTVRNILDALNVEVSGDKAIVYDYLCEQFK